MTTDGVPVKSEDLLANVNSDYKLYARKMFLGGECKMETKDPVELLRECLKYEHAFDLLRVELGIELKSGWHYACLEKLADEIEAQYMKLPVGADGLPIRPGDEVLHVADPPKFSKVVVAVNEKKFCCGPDMHYLSNMYKHVKHDAVAEELAKFLTACGDDDPHHYDEQIAEFAERIRKVVEHG